MSINLEETKWVAFSTLGERAKTEGVSISKMVRSEAIDEIMLAISDRVLRLEEQREERATGFMTVGPTVEEYDRVLAEITLLEDRMLKANGYVRT
jgi:hypothetical protein